MDVDIIMHNIEFGTFRLVVQAWLNVHRDHKVSPGPEDDRFIIARCDCGVDLGYTIQVSQRRRAE